MPFSETVSCNEEQWTWIFENVFKPAIEGAGLDYECRRSVATRGNIVAAILEDLRDAYVVLADLTDRNANVFYELGVRHSLKVRSILVAQKKDDIPFDLIAYAHHIYDWRTGEGIADLAKKLKQLLTDIDNNPDRADNPVSDFLGRTPKKPSTLPPISITPEEVTFAQSLAGPDASGLNAVDLAKRLAHTGQPQAATTILRLTRSELQPILRTTLAELNRSEAPGRVTRNQIPTIAQQYIPKIEVLVSKIEQFILSSIDIGWLAGAKLAIPFTGDWITATEQTQDGQIIRFAQGVPALLAWRLLILSGAKALANNDFGILAIILREPIEVEDRGGSFSNLPFLRRLDLFYSEAFLGYADYTAKYIGDVWKNQLHLHEFFSTEEEYHFQVAQFLMVLSIATATIKDGYPLYPGYRLLPQAGRAMSAFCSRLASSPDYIKGIERALGEYGVNLKETWTERAKAANSAELGGEYFLSRRMHFPEQLNSGSH